MQHEHGARPGSIRERWWLWLIVPVVLQAIGFIGVARQGRHASDPTLGIKIGGPIVSVVLVMVPLFIAGMRYQRSHGTESS